MSFETSVSAKDEVTQCRIRRKLCNSHAKTQLASFSRFDRCTQTQTWTQSHSIYRTNIAVKCAVDGGPTLNRWCLQWPCGPVDRVMLPMVGPTHSRRGTMHAFPRLVAAVDVTFCTSGLKTTTHAQDGGFRKRIWPSGFHVWPWFTIAGNVSRSKVRPAVNKVETDRRPGVIALPYQLGLTRSINSGWRMAVMSRYRKAVCTQSWWVYCVTRRGTICNFACRQPTIDYHYGT